MSKVDQVDQVDTKIESKPRGGLRQRFFNFIGWGAFALLIPPVLAMTELPKLQEFLIAQLGNWGSPLALIIYFYALLFLRVFFGSDQRYTPVLLGYGISFLYFSISLDIGFMRWFYEFVHRIPFLGFDVINLVAAVATIFLANALSGWKKAGMVADILLLVILPAAGLIAAGIFLPPMLGLVS